MDERESSDLYRVRKTLCQMLDDRGYVISEDDLTMNLTDFKELFTGENGKVARERCQITTCKDSDSTDQVRERRPRAALSWLSTRHP
jgi:DNA-directed RNA polymerase I, II, and III subunit RPABC1